MPLITNPQPGQHVAWYSKAGQTWRTGTVEQVVTYAGRTEAHIDTDHDGTHKVTSTVPIEWLRDVTDIPSRPRPADHYRKVAATYRANHHAEPDRDGLVWLHGRLWRTNRYTDVADLQAGAANYPRLAAMIGA